MADYGSPEWWEDRIHEANKSGKGGTISVRCHECLGKEGATDKCGCYDAMMEWEARLLESIGRGYLAGTARGITIDDAVSRVRS